MRKWTTSSLVVAPYQTSVFGLRGFGKDTQPQGIDDQSLGPKPLNPTEPLKPEVGLSVAAAPAFVCLPNPWMGVGLGSKGPGSGLKG